jgi:hypothetical protein
VYKLLIHDDAREELEELWRTVPRVAARITALLQEIQGSQELLDALTVHDFGAQGLQSFHVSKISKFWYSGLDIWRFKVWDLEEQRLKFRVVYAYEAKSQRYYVLGILPRAIAYDTNDPRVKRILKAYEDLVG